MNELFVDDFRTLRQRFNSACARYALQIEEIDIGDRDASGRDLPLMLAASEDRSQSVVLLVTAGVHGVEAAVGATVILDSLSNELILAASDAGIRVLLAPCVNPWGMVFRRRVNSDNIDLNRNAMGRAEDFTGADRHYERLESWLNPQRPPRPSDHLGCYARTGYEVARNRLRPLVQAVAGGQYEYPRGLFYGGRQMCTGFQQFSQWLRLHLQPGQRCLHLDLHSGLGRWRRLTLMAHSTALPPWLGASPDTWLEEQTLDVARLKTRYLARGTLAQWVWESTEQVEVWPVVAEFGTYNPLHVLSRLRTENMSHHFLAPQSNPWQRHNELLFETFVPAASTWRQKAISLGRELLARAVRVLKNISDEPTAASGVVRAKETEPR